jgi:hypothetical protein
MAKDISLKSESDPGKDIFLVAKSDTVNDTNGPFRGIIQGTAGAVKITTQLDQDVVLSNGVIAAGALYPIRFKRVWSTGTTNADIYGVK